MAPIRVGLIGLAPKSKAVAVGAWAATAHLPSILSLPEKYQIVALCNSSVESARASIAFHGLPETVRAYGNPSDLAGDHDVDLVVVSVRIDKHYQLIKPALEAGKMVYVEAPLAASLAEARELAKLAKKANVRTVVGTQGRASATVNKIRSLIAAGEIGTVLSSTLIGHLGGYGGSSTFPEKARWALDLESFGNVLLIGFGHLLDSHRSLLGEFADYSAKIESKLPDRDLIDDEGNIVEKAKSTDPDHIMMMGKLESGALSSIALRRNIKAHKPYQPVDNEDRTYCHWIIGGSEGEIRIDMPDVMWQASGNTLKTYLTKSSGTVEVEIPREHEDLHFLAQNTAALYKAFAEGDTSRYADFEDAFRLAEIMEELKVEGRRALRNTKK